MQICNSPFVFGGVKKENNYAGEGTLKKYLYKNLETFPKTLDFLKVLLYNANGNISKINFFVDICEFN